MSEQLNETVVPEAVGQPEPSGDPLWDESVAEIPADAPAPESEPSAETPSPEATTEPAPTEDYTLATLENGERELRLPTGQVYRGKTELDVIAQLAKAQTSASQRIAELGRQKPTETPAPTLTPNPSAETPLDPASHALLDLIAPAFGAKDGAAFIEQYRQQQQMQSEFLQQSQIQAVSQQFATANPDFVATPANVEKLGAQLALLGYGPNDIPSAQVLGIAHLAAKGAGLYEAAPPPAPRAGNGQFAPRMPLPPSGTAPAPRTGPSTPSLADLEAMSPEDLEKLMDSLAA